jgi:hypothetical protein
MIFAKRFAERNRSTIRRGLRYFFPDGLLDGGMGGGFNGRAALGRFHRRVFDDFFFKNLFRGGFAFLHDRNLPKKRESAKTEIAST